jgi:hypothetical protein
MPILPPLYNSQQTTRHPQIKEKLIELKGEIDNSSIMARDFKNQLSIMNITSRKKIK